MSEERHGDPRDARVSTLSRDELGREADIEPGRIDGLIAIGAIVPDGDGRFSRGDVLRSRLLSVFERAGIGLEHIEAGIRERALALPFIERFYPDPGPRSSRTFEEFAASLGGRGAGLPALVGAMGLPIPESTTQMHLRDERMLAAFLDTWSMADTEVGLRAARLFGDAVRHAAEGWVALFDEAIGHQLEGRSPTGDEIEPPMVEPAAAVVRLSHELMGWLLDRHLERTMNDLNISAMERELIKRGLVVPPPELMPAVAFIDLTDYTRLTAEKGDEQGASTAIRLAELADLVVRAHGGRLVKLLGDGVLVTFDGALPAVRAALELLGALDGARLPAGRAGVAAGPMIRRDGDVFGNTVNTASRVASQASPGQVLVTAAVVSEVADPDLVFEPIGERALKGLPLSVELFRATSRH